MVTVGWEHVDSAERGRQDIAVMVFRGAPHQRRADAQPDRQWQRVFQAMLVTLTSSRTPCHGDLRFELEGLSLVAGTYYFELDRRVGAPDGMVAVDAQRSRPKATTVRTGDRHPGHLSG